MSTGGSRIMDRMIGASRLDLATYEEIEADAKATGEAAFVVVATSFVAAAAAGLVAHRPADAGIAAAIGALIGWALSAWVALFVGTRLLPGSATKADWGEVARTVAFANTPRFFLIFMAVPGLVQAVQTVVSLWVLAATVIAMRAAFDVSTARAMVIGFVSWLAQGVVLIVLISVFLAAQ